MCFRVHDFACFLIDFHLFQEFLDLLGLILKLVGIGNDRLQILDELDIFPDFPIVVFLAPIADQFFGDVMALPVFILDRSLPDFGFFLESPFSFQT